MAVRACMNVLKLLSWPGPCVPASVHPRSPDCTSLDGQLLAASSVAVVVAGAVHILIQVLHRPPHFHGGLCPELHQGGLEERVEKLPKRTGRRGHTEKQTSLSGINSPSLERREGSGNQILKPLLLQKNKHNLVERVHWLTSYHHYTSPTIQSPPVP